MAMFSGYATTDSHSVILTIGLYKNGVLLAHTKRVYDVTNRPSNVSGAFSGTTSNIHMSTQGVVTVTGSDVVTVQWSVTNSGTISFVMANINSDAWSINELSGYRPRYANPNFFVNEGGSYTFTSTAGGGHPMSIKTVYQNSGTGNRYTTGVVGTPLTGGSLTWTVAVGAPTVLYYQCESHSGMSGTIVVMTVSVVANERSLELIKLS
jgi:plastocyanin